MRRRILTLALGLFLVAGLVPGGSADEGVVVCPVGHSASDEVVISSDGTKIAITVFRPSGAEPEDDPCGGPVPVVLTLHGWSGSRADDLDDDIQAGIAVRDLLDRGYAVVGIDARGHGDSGGEALVHHPSREVNDFRAVLDWIHDELPWVEREGPPSAKDIVAGALGASYGGGFQLMTAAFDDRLDVLVPIVTWNDLPQSLAPSGAIKSDWVVALYAAAKLSVDVDRRIDEWFVEGAATNRFPPDAKESFRESSPASWMQGIDTPTFLVQGMPDTLFPLNEAVHNFVGIGRNDAPVWLYGVNTGHVLPGLQPTGLNPPARQGIDTCATENGYDSAVDLLYDVYAAFLDGDPDARGRLADFPRVALPTEDGETCVSAGGWPVNDAEREAAFPAVVVPQAGGTQFLELFTAEEATTVAGIPTFRAATPLEVDDIFYLSLVVETAEGFHVVDDQVMGARTQLASLEGTYAVDLGGVATTLHPGDTLYLRIDGANEQYALNGNRRPGAAVFSDVTVSVPVVE